MRSSRTPTSTTVSKRICSANRCQRKARIQIGVGGKGEEGRARVSSNSGSIVCSSNRNRWNSLSTVAARVELRCLAPTSFGCYSPRVTWEYSGSVPFETDSQVLPIGWVPTDPPGRLPPMPPPPAGWGPLYGGSRRGRGRCFRFIQPGYFVAECSVPLSHVRTSRSFLSPPALTAQRQRSMVRVMVPRRSPLRCPTVADCRTKHPGVPLPKLSPPQPSSSSPDLMNNGSCAPLSP